MFDPFRLQDIIEVDAETKEMLKMMDFQSIPGLQMTTAGKQYSLYQLTSFYLLFQVVEAATPTTRATATELCTEALTRRRRDHFC